MKIHKNSQKRIYGDHIYFITCAVQDKFNFFKASLFCDLWLSELKLCKEIKRFRIFAFCLNYEHFHWMIKADNEIADYSKIMQFLKRNFSIDANKIMGFIFERDDPMLRSNERDEWEHGDEWDRRLRIWEHREYISQLRGKFISSYGKHHNFPKFKWQKSFHDHIIRNQRDYDNHWRYTMYNFKKHGLPEDWQYTGLNFPELIDEL